MLTDLLERIPIDECATNTPDALTLPQSSISCMLYVSVRHSHTIWHVYMYSPTPRKDHHHHAQSGSRHARGLLEICYGSLIDWATGQLRQWQSPRTATLSSSSTIRPTHIRTHLDFLTTLARYHRNSEVPAQGEFVGRAGGGGQVFVRGAVDIDAERAHYLQ